MNGQLVLMCGLSRSTNRHESPPSQNRHDRALRLDKSICSPKKLGKAKQLPLQELRKEKSGETGRLHVRRVLARRHGRGPAAPRGAVCGGRVGCGRGLVVVRGGARGARAAGRAPRGDGGGGRRRGAVPGPASRRGGGAAVRGGVRGRGRRDAAHHQRQVRGPLHRGAEPTRPRPRRRLPGARHRAQAHQEHLAMASIRTVSIGAPR